MSLVRLKWAVLVGMSEVEMFCVCGTYVCGKWMDDFTTACCTGMFRGVIFGLSRNSGLRTTVYRLNSSNRDGGRGLGIPSTCQ